MKYKKEIEHIAVTQGGMQKIQFRVFAHHFVVEGTDGTAIKTYMLPLGVAIGYATSYGVWTFLCDDGGITFRANNSNTEERAVVFEVDPGPGRHYNRLIEDDIDEGLKGKHYDAIIEDDMADAFAYVMNSLQPKVKWTGITAEGGDKMKALYHVILFNRKTEEIAFKEYVPAKSEMDATMMAAQIYNSYDSDVHKVIVKGIADSEYEPIK